MATSRLVFESIANNLRFRWRRELANYSDEQIIRAYDDFSLSEDFGDNDKKFPERFGYIMSYSDAPYKFSDGSFSKGGK